jgi:Tfp pilus assembly protein PilF
VPVWLDPPVDEVLRARVVIGTVLLQQGQASRAREQAERALETAPRWPEGRALRAHALFGEQRWAEAAREYREYLTARPRDVRALLNYGVSLVATSRLDEAVSVFRLAVAVDPSNAEAKRLLALAETDRARLAQ